MPNGGTHHCALYCCHFDNERNFCGLRKLHIDLPAWTTCKNFNDRGRTVIGPLYAKVCEVHKRTGSYCNIPYFDGYRADTIQNGDGTDTVVRYTDRAGISHTFPTVKGYLEHYENNDPERHRTRLQISRERARALGEETLEILNLGHYKAPSGATVEIGKQVKESAEGTVSYPPEQAVTIKPGKAESAFVEVRNETTLEAVKRLFSNGMKPVALNFASATNPGGGFLTGARAQEEYLARSSALWACLRDNPMYSFHWEQRDPFYSDYVIYSPDVPVFRTDEGELLETPYKCSFLTSPAVNATTVSKNCPERIDEISGAMMNRILKVLAVASWYGHESVVLGAWGCGVFGNSSEEMARLFRKALHEDFPRSFEHVVFAITDWSKDQHFIGPFLQEFN